MEFRRVLFRSLGLRKLVSPLHWSGSAPDFRIFLDLSECTRETAGFDGAALVGWSGEIADADIEANLPAAFAVRPFELMSTPDYDVDGRSDERRVGKEWVSTCRSGW